MHGPPGVLAAKGRSPVFVITKDVEDGPLCAAQIGVPEIEYRATRGRNVTQTQLVLLINAHQRGPMRVTRQRA